MQTTAELLSSIKRGAAIPAYQPRFTNSDLLAMADEEISSRIAPLIKDLRADYFLTSSTTSTVASTSSYQIPYRAIGGTISDLQYSTDGGSTYYSLRQINSKDAVSAATGQPESFYFLNDKVCLYPTPSSAGTLKFTFEMAPNKLVETSECMAATSLTSTSVTGSAVPSGLTAGLTVDFIKIKGQCANLAVEKSITNASSDTLSFTSGDIPSDFAVGDYVCLAGTSCLLQIPQETRPLLALMVQARVFESLGDDNSLQACEAKLKQKMESVKGMLTPRITQEPQIILGGLHPNRGRPWRQRRI